MKNRSETKTYSKFSDCLFDSLSIKGDGNTEGFKKISRSRFT